MSKVYQECDNKQYSIKTTKEQFSELMGFCWIRKHGLYWEGRWWICIFI